MKDTIIILHAERVEYRRRDSNGERNGDLVQFCRIQYISDEPQDDARYKGYTISQGTGPVEMYGDLELLPGLYEAKFPRRSSRTATTTSGSAWSPRPSPLLEIPASSSRA